MRGRPCRKETPQKEENLPNPAWTVLRAIAPDRRAVWGLPVRAGRSSLADRRLPTLAISHMPRPVRTRRVDAYRLILLGGLEEGALKRPKREGDRLAIALGLALRAA